MSIALPSGASLVAQMIKNPPACRRTGFNPWVGKIPWRREWQPTPLFLPEQFHGQRSLADPSPWGCKESDTIEQLTLTLSLPSRKARYSEICMLSHFNHVRLCVTLWTIAYQALLYMGFSRQEYWSGLPRSSTGALPDPGTEPPSLALAGGFLTASATWESLHFRSAVPSLYGTRDWFHGRQFFHGPGRGEMVSG